MIHHSFFLGDANLHALASGALFWPAQNLLCVSDLHLGKSERLARRGGALLPPYETRATLEQLETAIDHTGARRIVCLGDSFDDLAAVDGLDESDRLWLLRLMAGREWIWIEGNHDAGPSDIGGTHLAELTIAGTNFRHISNGQDIEITGHYHPKAQLAGRSKPCFLYDEMRLIMPAFGVYTGGLWIHDAKLRALMSPVARAVLTGPRCHVIPMPR
jgi:DNA ligase-associated metallophosphoesterase